MSAGKRKLLRGMAVVSFACAVGLYPLLALAIVGCCWVLIRTGADK